MSSPLPNSRRRNVGGNYFGNPTLVSIEGWELVVATSATENRLSFVKFGPGHGRIGRLRSGCVGGGGKGNGEIHALTHFPSYSIFSTSDAVVNGFSGTIVPSSPMPLR